MGSFRELKVWRLNQECIKQSLNLLRSLKDDFAYQHIAKQLFRAISSVGANIAEGQDSYEGKEFIRYFNIAIHSGIECDHWLATLENLYPSLSFEKLKANNLEVIKMLKGLRRSIEQKRT